VTGETELIDRLRNGDRDAFDTIFRRWYPPLVRVAEGMLHDRAAAEEIVQDVMFGLWQHRSRFSTQGSPQGYLFRATRNRALNYLRHQKVRRASEPRLMLESAAAPSAETQLEEDQIDAAVRQAVATLPERCREVFELSRMHGLKYAEIAQALDISVKTVETQMGKALRVLRERLAGFLDR
jgi:RNA polymerase sigma-70 factor (ECF subfamily)